MSMVSAKMVHVFALPGGMESTAQWRDALKGVLAMDNVESMGSLYGSVDAMRVGMEKIVAWLSSKAAQISETMTKVSKSLQ